MRASLLVVALTCIGSIFAGQDPATAAGEITQHDAPATFSSRANLVQVPVIVRDKQGHVVGNLTKDDFQLFDKGKPQLISKFIIEKVGTPYIPAVTATDELTDRSQPTLPIPERFIAYLFDDVHLTAGDLLRLRQAAVQHVDNHLDAVTRFAIVTTSGFGVLDFTDDIAKIHEALNGLKPNMRTPTTGNDCPNVSFYMADLIVNKNDTVATGVALADAKACSDSLTTTSTNDLQAMVRSASLSALNIGETESTRVLNSLLDLSKRMSAMPGSRNIVLISPGFLLPGEDLRPAEVDILDRAIRSNVTINTLDARGVFTAIPGGDASERAINTTAIGTRSIYDASAFVAQQDVLQEIAYGTGGTFFHNDNGFAEGLNQVTKQPEFIYLLGFSPGDLKYDGAYHSLKVSLRSPAGLTVQARQGYYSPKRPTDPLEAAKEDIREEVFSRDEIQDIPVDVRLQYYKSTPVTARLTVRSRLDIKTLHFRKDQDRSKDTITVVSALFDRNGTFVNGTQRIVEMNLLDATRTRIETSGLTVSSTFDVTPGSYAIRLVVRDSEGQMMAARNGAVQIP